MDDLLFESLEAWLRREPKDRDQSYPCIRCAGLFRSLYALMGERAAPQENADIAREAFDRTNLLTVTALFIKGNRSHNYPASTVTQVGKEIMAFADAYAARYNQNIDESGIAFANDELIIDDLRCCGDVAAEAARLNMK